MKQFSTLSQHCIFLCTFCVIFVMTSNMLAATLHVDQKNSHATDTGNGSNEAPFKTINAAALVAQKGDTVLVHPGIYREMISPGTNGGGVNYMSAMRHQAIVKGSDVWTPKWEAVKDQPDVFVAPLDPSLFAGKLNPYSRTISVSARDVSKDARPVKEDAKQWPLTLGQIFVDGQPMNQVTTPEDVRDLPGSWIVGAQGNTILLHLPKHLRKIEAGLVELTTRDRIFFPSRRGLADITIEGFVFEHGANQGPFPQYGIVSVRSGKNWTIRDNIVRYATTVGLDIGSECWDCKNLPNTDDDQKHLIIGGNHQVLDNLVEDNGLCGIAGWNCAGSRINGNIVQRNNRFGFESKINAEWEENAGIKVHAFYGGVMEGNLIINNDAAGIWIDNGHKDARISRNFICSSLGKGIFIELGEGPCFLDHNVIAYTRSDSDFYAGDGIYTHDASDLIIANNLLFHNARFGVHSQVVTNRTLGADKHLVETSNHQIIGNLFIGNNVAAISMPFAGTYSRNNVSDHNVFVGKNSLLSVHNNQGRVKSDVIINAYQQVLVDKKIPEAQQPRFAEWIKDGRVNLANWQAIMQQDQHSVEAPACSMSLSPGDGVFTVLEADSTWSTSCPPIKGIEKDFFGRNIAEANCAGPFGKIQPGFNRWSFSWMSFIS